MPRTTPSRVVWPCVGRALVSVSRGNGTLRFLKATKNLRCTAANTVIVAREYSTTILVAKVSRSFSMILRLEIPAWKSP